MPGPEPFAASRSTGRTPSIHLWLAPFVKRGVALHYGNMSSLVRLEIERLFRTGKLKFLVCTPILIEGVNLSCRTILVRGPKRGKRTPMEPQNFWNLAGRGVVEMNSRATSSVSTLQTRMSGHRACHNVRATRSVERRMPPCRNSTLSLPTLQSSVAKTFGAVKSENNVLFLDLNLREMAARQS